MTSVPRDPAFWKRFSYAVHLDEEKATAGGSGPKESESWLARQQSKKNRRTRICWLFWILFFILVAAAVIAVIVCLDQGVFDKLGEELGTKASEASASATASSTATAAGQGSAVPSATAMPAGYR